MSAALIRTLDELRDQLKQAAKEENVAAVFKALSDLDKLEVDVNAIKISKIAAVVKKITEIPFDVPFKGQAVALLAKWRSTAVHEHKADALLTEVPAAAAPASVSRQRSNSKLEDYECRVCAELMVEPSTLHCGHTCCRTCLFKWLKNTENAKCPAGCTTVIPRKLPKVNIILRDKIVRTFPEEYKQRKQDAEADVLSPEDQEEYKKMDEEVAVEAQRGDDEKRQEAVRQFIGSLMAQAQWTLANVEGRLRDRNIRYARVGPALHYRLSRVGEDGKRCIIKYKVSMDPNGCLKFTAKFGSVAPEQYERMVSLLHHVNYSLREGSLEVNADTALLVFKVSVLIDHVPEEEMPPYIDRALNSLHAQSFQLLPVIKEIDAAKPVEGEGKPEAAYTIYQRHMNYVVPLASITDLPVLAGSFGADFNENGGGENADRDAVQGRLQNEDNFFAITSDDTSKDKDEPMGVTSSPLPLPPTTWQSAHARMEEGGLLHLLCGLCGSSVATPRPADYAAHVTACLRNFEKDPALQGGAKAMIDDEHKGEEAVPRCPQAHALSAHLTPHHSTTYTCDICSKKIGKKVFAFCCRLCDYDACSSCYANAGGDATSKPHDPSAEVAPTLKKCEEALIGAGIKHYEKIVCRGGEEVHIRFYIRGGEVRPILCIEPKRLVWYMHTAWEVPSAGRAAVAKEASSLNCMRIYGNWETQLDQNKKGFLRFRISTAFEPAAAAAASISATSLNTRTPNFKPLLINYFKVGVQTFQQDIETLGKIAAESSNDIVFAARTGSLEKVKSLLERTGSEKCDVNSVGKDQQSALMVAAYRGHDEIVDALMEAGANVDHLTKEGHGALVMAIFSRYEVLALKLAKASSFQVLNAVDDEGENPMLDASRMGLVTVVQYLISKGVKLDHKNKRGQSALSVAMAAKRQEVVTLLLEHLGPYAAIEAAALAATANDEPTARTTAESCTHARRNERGDIVREEDRVVRDEEREVDVDHDEEDPERPLANVGRDLNTN